VTRPMSCVPVPMPLSWVCVQKINVTLVTGQSWILRYHSAQCRCVSDRKIFVIGEGLWTLIHCVKQKCHIRTSKPVKPDRDSRRYAGIPNESGDAILVLTLRNSLIPVNAAYVLFQSRTDACSRDLISLNSRFFSPLNLDAHF
jgi:hypothetical protein